MKRVLFALAACALASCAAPRATSGSSPSAPSADQGIQAPSARESSGSGSGEVDPSLSGKRPYAPDDPQQEMHAYEWWEAGG